MNARRLPPCALAAVMATTAACAPKVVPPAPAPLADVIVLAPDPDDARAGAVTVTTPQGTVELAADNASTRVGGGQAPSAPVPMADDEIQRRFGGAMSARPLPPREFLLYFESGGDTLTAESMALVPEIVEFVRQRPAPDVSVIGHTDTTGEAAANVALGLQRATLIRGLLVTSGLDPSRVDVASHGETNLLVSTPDDTAEAKNRRVEVTVR
jgi:outer membrane protein OmpA-like peptidoglycan-associated protein